MPHTVDVNGVRFRIERAALTPDVDGYTMCTSRVIYISQNPKMDEREDLTHELTHAFVCMDAAGKFGVDNTLFNSQSNDDHAGLERFSQMWAELLRRNPQLADYLTAR